MTKRITPDLLLQHLQEERHAGRMTIVQSLWFEDAAQVWAAEQREREILQQNWQRCVDHAARVEEENGRLREALRPLAELDFSAWSEAHEDDDAVLLLALEVGVGTGGTACITIGDVRRAREALAATTDPQVNPEKRDD